MNAPRSIEFMLPGESAKVHDPLSMIMSTERKTSVVSASGIDELRIVHERKRLFDEDSEVIKETPEEDDSDTNEEEEIGDVVGVMKKNAVDGGEKRLSSSSSVPPSPSPPGPRRKSSVRVQLDTISTPPPDTRRLPGLPRAMPSCVLPLPPPSTSASTHQCVVQGHVFSAIDVPGRPAFRHAWYERLSSVCCIIMVVDCSDWESLVMAAEQIRRLSGKEGAGKVNETVPTRDSRGSPS